MAQVTTATPTVSVRERSPGIPDDGDGNIAGELDLATYEGFAFLSSFVIPGGCSFSYDSSGPSLSIGAGRVARYTGDRQELVSVDAVSGLSLASGTVNYVYFRADNVWEVRDADEPPGPDALLAGTVDTATRAVDEAVRGRSPIPSGIPGVGSGGGDDPTEDPPAVLEAESLGASSTRYFRERISSTERVALYRAGVIADSLSSTSGVAARVVTESDSTVHHSTEAKRAVGEPLATIAGPADVRFELSNTSGSSVAGVSGRWTYRIEPVTAPVVPTNWDQFRADLRKTGTISSTGPTGSASTDWTYLTGGNVQSSPSVVDGTVYVGSNDSTLYALAASDGSEQWTYTLDAAPFYSSPAIADGLVAIADDNGTVHAVNQSDGSGAWTHSVGSGTFSSPAIANGTVYVGGGDGLVYALDTADGSEQWTYDTGSEINAPPAVVDGTVYIGNGAADLYALAASDGSLEWTYTQAATYIRSAPAVVDGTVYVNGGGSDTHAVATSDGSQEWLYDAPAAMQSSPAVANGQVFVFSSSILHALAASDGSEQWTYSFGTQGTGSPAVVDGYVYAVDNGGAAAALATSDGSVNWTNDLGTSVVSSPAVLDGTLYVGAYDDNVYALE